MSLTAEFKEELKQYSLNYKEVDHVEQAIAEADVILVEPVVQPDYTKSRDERSGKDVGLTPANYKITRELLEHEGQVGCHPAAFPAAHGRNPGGCGYHALVALLAGSLQRRRDAHGAAGAGAWRDGIDIMGVVCRMRTARIRRINYANQSSRS